VPERPQTEAIFRSDFSSPAGSSTSHRAAALRTMRRRVMKSRPSPAASPVPSRRVPCTVYRVPCTVYRVPCTVYRVPCTVYRVPCTAREYRTAPRPPARHNAATSSLCGLDAASASAATGRALRRRILATTAFVFVTFLLRCVLSTTLALSYELRDFEKPCHFVGWATYTPAFESTIILISSPLTLLVALWGMTSNASLQLMKSSGRDSALSLRLITSSKQQNARAVPGGAGESGSCSQ
jgi:hypothetical protein